MVKLLKRVLAFSIVLALCTSAVPARAADTAAAIRLTKTEGTVGVTNSGGRSLSQRDDMRLYNGYHVATQAKSYAWISLDNEKLNKLDESSDVEVRKAGKLLELLLDEGNLYFNVTEPLEEDESLNIRTSTMVVGIRGTCGWVKVLDQYNTMVYVLEGTVWCTVSDPVSGQSKTTALSGGESARFTVYRQEQNGEKCDIFPERFTEGDIDGFVLAELVGDNPMCEKIFEDSGLDLRNLTQEQVRDRLEADQAENAEKQREKETLKLQQENNVSIDPVWTQPDSASSDSGGEGGTSSTPDAPSAVVRLTMPVTDMEVQQALNRSGVSQVVVEPGGDPARNTLEIGISMTVPAGKTLTLEQGVPAEIRGSLTVNGTADVAGDLHNLGTIAVNSANTLRVGGTLTNEGQFIASATGRSITEGSFVTGSGTVSLTEGAQVMAGEFQPEAGSGWRVAAQKVNGYDILEIVLSRKSTLTLNLNNGEAPLTVETDDNGRLTEALPTPERDGYVFEGWFTEEGSTDPADKVDENTQFTGDATLYAVWTADVGDFKVSGGTLGTDYSFGPEENGYNILTILTAQPLTIAMKDGVAQTTTDRIFVDDGVSANITLAGVNIDLSATGAFSNGGRTGTLGLAAFQIAEDNSGNVTVTLATGAENVLTSGAGRGGLEKNGSTALGTLTIRGTGKLTTTGGAIFVSAAPDTDFSGAGIGSSGFSDGRISGCTNIIIENGEILAYGNKGLTGSGIGDCDGDAHNIQIKGGTVTAQGGLYSADIFAEDITISGGTLTGHIGTYDDITITGGTVNGGIHLYSAGSFTMTGGEIVSDSSTQTVSLAAGSQITLTGGTITNTGTSPALSLADAADFPAACGTVIRGMAKTVDPLPDGYIEVQESDGYYYLRPWVRTTLYYEGITAEAIQAALAYSNEVYIETNSTSTQKVTLTGDLTIPAGKTVSIELNTNLDIGESGGSAPTLTVEGTLVTGLDLFVYGTMTIGAQGEVEVHRQFRDYGMVENSGELRMRNDNKVFGVYPGGAMVNRGTIDCNSPYVAYVDGPLENSGTIKNVTCFYVNSDFRLTGGTITANSTNSVFSLQNSGTLELLGGTVTQENPSGHLVLFNGADAALPETIGTTLRGAGDALLWESGADVTDAKGYLAVRMEDGYYYLVKKEETP